MLWLALRSVAIFVLAGIVTLVMRRKSASMRHLVWLAAFVAVAAMPVFARLIPISKVQPPASTVRSLGPIAPLIVPPSNARPSPSSSTPVALPASAERVRPPESADVVVGTYVADVTTNPFLLLPVLYGLGVVVLLFHYAASFRRLSRALHRYERSETLPNGVRMLVTAPGRLSTPATFGWPRATILMPFESESWPEERRRAAIQHELAHIERADWVWQCLALIVCTIQWFNPLAWFAAVRLQAEAEGAADDAVLRKGLAASSYAQELLEVAKGIRRETSLVVPIGRPGGIARRVRAIVAPHRDRSAANRSAHLAAGTGTVFCAAILGGLGLSAAAASTPNPRPQDGAFRIDPKKMELRPLAHLGAVAMSVNASDSHGVLSVGSRDRNGKYRAWDQIGLPAASDFPGAPRVPEIPGRKLREFVLECALHQTLATRLPAGAEVVQRLRTGKKGVLTVSFPADAQATYLEVGYARASESALKAVPIKPTAGPDGGSYGANLRWFAVPIEEARYRVTDRFRKEIPLAGQWFRKGDSERMIAVDAAQAAHVERIETGPILPAQFLKVGPIPLDPAPEVAIRKDAPIDTLPLAGNGTLTIQRIRAATPGFPHAMWTVDGGPPRSTTTEQPLNVSPFGAMGYLWRQVDLSFQWPAKPKAPPTIQWKAQEDHPFTGTQLRSDPPTRVSAAFNVKPDVQHIHARVGYAFEPWEVRGQEAPKGPRFNMLVWDDLERRRYGNSVVNVSFTPSPEILKLDFDVEALDAKGKPLEKLGVTGPTKRRVRNVRTGDEQRPTDRQGDAKPDMLRTGRQGDATPDMLRPGEAPSVLDEERTYAFHAESKREIAQVRLKVRPMYWIELPPLPMHPKKKP